LVFALSWVTPVCGASIKKTSIWIFYRV